MLQFSIMVLYYISHEFVRMYQLFHIRISINLFTWNMHCRPIIWNHSTCANDLPSQLAELFRNANISPFTIYWRHLATFWQFFIAGHLFSPVPVSVLPVSHNDVIKWKHFPRYWPFVRGIPRSPVNSPHKGQWRGALMFSLIWVWIDGWVKNG